MNMDLKMHSRSSDLMCNEDCLNAGPNPYLTRYCLYYVSIEISAESGVGMSWRV